MPVFQYRARTTAGQLVARTLTFPDEPALREYLRQDNLYVVDVKERGSGSLLGALRRGVPLGDLILMVRQLRTMINAGMPLVTGLEALAEQAPNARLGETLSRVSRSVAHGASLADTFGEYPEVFPTLLVDLVRAGEEGGRLPETLREAARQFELQMEIRQKMISALVYPVFTLAATVGTVLFMLLFIVPVFAGIYRDLHATLPPITLSLVSLSNLIISSGWLVLLLALASVVMFRRYVATPEGKRQVDGLLLRLPLFGTLFLKSGSARLTGSLAGLLESGVPLVTALPTAARVASNEALGDALREAAKGVVAGQKLSRELERSGRFPIAVVRMVGVAEEVGTLPQVLREIADSYNEEVDYTVRRVVSLVEPILVLTVGAVVGYVLLALYYPIFNLSNVFMKGA